MADDYQKQFKLGIIGFPLEKTFSPLIHEIFLRETGLTGEYLPYPVTSGNLESMVMNLSRERLCGVNVTYPYKRKMVEYCDILTGAAEDIGVVNTIAFKMSGVEGWNTDAAGYAQAIVSAEASPPFYIVGNGGVARAVVHVLENSKRKFKLYCRTPVEWCRSFALPLSELNGIGTGEGTVVNATTLGWNDNDLFPLNPALMAGKLFFDLNYNPNWIWRNSLANRVETGEEMLITQAAESFRIWTGVTPGVGTALSAVREAMTDIKKGTG